jgi:6-phosphogluconolactonase/glucosamine-6-phosphate isomerase/deaminase
MYPECKGVRCDRDSLAFECGRRLERASAAAIASSGRFSCALPGGSVRVRSSTYAIEGAPSGPAEPSPLARATREHPDVAWLLDPDAAAVISR